MGVNRFQQLGQLFSATAQAWFPTAQAWFPAIAQASRIPETLASWNSQSRNFGDCKRVSIATGGIHWRYVQW
ncbi:hypothetical protein RHMOL_Rhmol07G0202400 [Rhododendron molle]|uniref:Uncharacterized protein n=1 Tax=Rhododendron molle TaxID=49168 RepID=A0ACC0N2I2_RHOML|nr:hypothetical protein RHMOL_Rhmol07G0202400 [Rhododendron molle]